MEWVILIWCLLLTAGQAWMILTAAALHRIVGKQHKVTRLLLKSQGALLSAVKEGGD